MPSPPLMLLCAAGVGLAALLYYYFAAREDRERLTHGYAVPSGDGYRPRRQRQRCGSSSRYELEDCSICQEIVVRPAELRTLPCGHHFHFRCIEKWLEAFPVATPATCPNCRQEIH